MDRPLALAAEHRGAVGLGAEAVGIGEVAERAVERTQAVGPGGDHHPGDGVVPDIAPVDLAPAVGVGVGEHVVVRMAPADAGGAGLGRGGVVGDAEMQRLVARARRGDLVDVLHAQRRLDDHLQADLLGVALGLLDLGEQHVDGVDVLRRAGLGDHDQIELVARLLDDVDHVAVHVMGVEAVDPHRQRASAPVEVVQRLDHVLARLLLVGGRDGILEVEEDDVGVTLGRLLEERGVGPRNRQLGAVQARCALLDNCETHDDLPGTSRRLIVGSGGYSAGYEAGSTPISKGLSGRDGRAEADGRGQRDSRSWVEKSICHHKLCSIFYFWNRL